MWQKLKEKLSNTRKKFSNIKSLLSNPNDEAFDELEMHLLSADVGVNASRNLIENLKRQARGADNSQLPIILQKLMRDSVADRAQPLIIDDNAKPFVILVIGVNGSGKTTTIGKLAHYYKQQGKSVMLAAGDTFRAAAIEQLTIWGERFAVPVIAQDQHSDSAAVIYDAYQSAKSRGIDVLIADTAGRMHTDKNLMEELKKIKRMLEKQNISAPNETLLVIDGNTGRNSLLQIEHFHKAVKVDGLIITKLDGSAKGGILFAIGEECNLPVRFIGVGEGGDDLQIFDADSYVSALLDS